MQDYLFEQIKTIARDVSLKVGPTKWYLFGSALNYPQAATDVDVLVVCPTSDIADAIRNFIDSDSLYRPLHLSILTDEEEKEISFIKNQACHQVY